MSVEKAKKYASIRHRNSIFNVEIEDVDESWALKLLNECEQEDSVITVQNMPDEYPFRRKDICLISQTEHSVPNDPPQSSLSMTIVEALDKITYNSPSAIESQMIAMATRQHAERLVNRQKIATPRLSIERLKAFFVV